MEIKVRCYSGYFYAEEPRSFIWQDEEFRIKAVHKAWVEPGKRLFKVLIENGELFELCYNQATDKWTAVELTF